jgi:ankyrin repeat protein
LQPNAIFVNLKRLSHETLKNLIKSIRNRMKKLIVALIVCINALGPTGLSGAATSQSNLGWDLLSAAKSGNAAKVEKLLSLGADANIMDDRKGHTPLYRAALHGHVEVVRILLSRPEVDVNVQALGRDRTPLHEAAYRGPAIIVKMLLDAPGILVNAADRAGFTPLHEACRCNPAAVALLLAAPNIDINLRNEKGATPLHLAAGYKCNPAVVALLLAAPNIDINLRDEDGNTPLHLAAIWKNYAVVKLLLNASGIKKDPLDNNDCTPLHCAVVVPKYFYDHKEQEKYYLKTVKRLLKTNLSITAASQAGTPLHLAAEVACPPIIKLLLTLPDIDLNVTHNLPVDSLSIGQHQDTEFFLPIIDETTPLDWLCVGPDDSQEVGMYRKECARLLIQNGAQLSGNIKTPQYIKDLLTYNMGIMPLSYKAFLACPLAELERAPFDNKIYQECCSYFQQLKTKNPVIYEQLLEIKTYSLAEKLNLVSGLEQFMRIIPPQYDRFLTNSIDKLIEEPFDARLYQECCIYFEQLKTEKPLLYTQLLEMEIYCLKIKLHIGKSFIRILLPEYKKFLMYSVDEFMEEYFDARLYQECCTYFEQLKTDNPMLYTHLLKMKTCNLEGKLLLGKKFAAMIQKVAARSQEVDRVPEDPLSPNEFNRGRCDCMLL